MSEENKQIVNVGLLVIAALCVVMIAAVVGCHECEETSRAAIKAGMQQSSSPGWNGSFWQYPAEKGK